ncbi:MAG: PIN domain-containing protein [Sphingobacteriaceae bacterium]|nr:MAG: PIN domain-containing protein [Sphingobacteriaceae bacterium]
MASKILLDANVLLDFTLQRKNYENTKQLIGRIINGEFHGFVTPSIVHIIGYWLSKSYGAIKAKQIILELLTDIKVIDCNHIITISALNSQITDIEDALQYYTALYHKLDFFISQDKNLQKAAIPNLPVYTVEEFIGTHQ